MSKDFAMLLRHAADSQDWRAYARIWEDRRVAEVEYDEAMIDRARKRAKRAD